MKAKNERQRQYTTAQAAEIVGLTPGRLRQLAQAGEIGEVFENQWSFSIRDIEKLIEERS